MLHRAGAVTKTRSKMLPPMQPSKLSAHAGLASVLRCSLDHLALHF